MPRNNGAVLSKTKEQPNNGAAAGAWMRLGVALFACYAKLVFGPHLVALY